MHLRITLSKSQYTKGQWNEVTGGKAGFVMTRGFWKIYGSLAVFGH